MELPKIFKRQKLTKAERREAARRSSYRLSLVERARLNMLSLKSLKSEQHGKMIELQREFGTRTRNETLEIIFQFDEMMERGCDDEDLQACLDRTQRQHLFWHRKAREERLLRHQESIRPRETWGIITNRPY
jgi:hypothetical protein